VRDGIALEVATPGHATAAEPGLGRLGMRERAAASGGTLEAGPRARGGWLVRAAIPLAERMRADA
jgi:signal transduction histidine kinase